MQARPAGAKRDQTSHLATAQQSRWQRLSRCECSHRTASHLRKLFDTSGSAFASQDCDRGRCVPRLPFEVGQFDELDRVVRAAASL